MVPRARGAARLRGGDSASAAGEIDEALRIFPDNAMALLFESKLYPLPQPLAEQQLFNAPVRATRYGTADPELEYHAGVIARLLEARE